ncbi:unnamed protein product [Haemonchus placei]|uniref:Transposase n=1 Tax=Haemonchus placei TaxID=6290 RepID=A0A0N4WC77_HAEPC|nr:unnamed protein product [Haemonchus placei]
MRSEISRCNHHGTPIFYNGAWFKNSRRVLKYDRVNFFIKEKVVCELFRIIALRCFCVGQSMQCTCSKQVVPQPKCQVIA